MKKILIASVVLLMAAGCSKTSPVVASPAPTPVTQDAKNSTYFIEGQNITLINGKAEVLNNGNKTVVQYFGNETVGDLNNDGLSDTAFLLTEDNGGSGTFFYVAVALKTAGGYTGTNAILLGDRIAPQTTEYKNGEIIVNYADRNPGEPMTIKPSLGVSKYFKITDNQLKEIAPQ